MTVENISIAVKVTGADTGARQINSLATALSNLEKSSAVVTASSDLSALADAMRRFSGIQIDTRGIARFADGVDNLAAILRSVSPENIETMERLAEALGSLNGFRGSTTGIANGLESITDSLKLLTDEDIERLRRIAEVLSGLNGVNLSGLSGATGVLRSLTNQANNASGSTRGLSAHANRASHSIRSLGDSARHSSGMLGKLWASIKRIAFYRLLRTFIKELSQSFQEGLKNAYAFSKAIGGSLAPALDSLKSATGQMKNQMGAAFGELLQTIMPVINAIVAGITSLMNALSALFAALGGRLTYTVAEKTAESWDDAAGSAKEYKNTVLGFDELNKLNDETGGGGGGGSDPGAFGELELPDWAKKIQEAIKLEDWYGAGKALADYLNSLIDAWDAYEAGRKLGEKINHVLEFAFGFLKNFDFGNLGKKIAEFFNGIFDTVNWDLLGRVLVRAFTGILDFLIGFIENIDTGSIARAISNFLKGALEEATEWLTEHNWQEFGNTVTQKIKDFFDNLDAAGVAVDISGFLTRAFLSIGNFFDGGDWSGVGTSISNKIHEFITNINWKRITETLSRALIKAFNAARDFVNGVDWQQLGSDVLDMLSRTIEGIDFAGIAKSLFELFGAAIASAIEFIWPFIKEAGLGIYNYFMQYIDIDSEDNWLEIGAKILGGILEGVAQALVDIWNWLMDNVVHPLIKGFLDAFGIHSPSTVMRDEVGVFVGEGLLEGIAAPFIAIYNWLKENIVDPIVNNIKSLLGIDGENSSVFSGIGEKIVNGLSDGFKAAWDTFVTNVRTWWDGLKNWFSGLSLKLDLKGTTVNENGFSHSSGKIPLEASGGVIPNDGTLFVAGEAGAEVVANMGSRTGVMNVDQMEAAVANGNIGVINAVYGMANMIVKAVNEIDPDITLDGQSMANAMYKYNQQAANRHGMAMVT